MRLAAMTAMTFALMLSACSVFDRCNHAAVDCIEWEDISYTNNTEEKLFVDFSGDGPEGYQRLSSGETRTIPFVLPRKPQFADHRYDDINDPVYIHFRDDSGCRAFSISTTVRKIREDHDSAFTIRQGDLKPALERVGCDPAVLPEAPYD